MHKFRLGEFRFFSLIAVITLGFFVASCATMSEEECVAADWAVVGEADGAAGYAPQERFAGHVKACSKAGITPDQTLWNQGFQKGLVRYCTAENGLRVGEAGSSYANVCPLDKAPVFLSGYNLGKKAHTIRSQINSKRSSISYKKRQIDEKFKSVGSLTEAQQVALQYEAAELNKQIAKDELEITRLQGELSRVEREIQDFRLRISYN